MAPDQTIETFRGILANVSGLSGAEIVLNIRKYLSLEAKEGQLESHETAETVGLSLRLQRGKKIAQSYASIIDLEQFKTLIGRCETLLEIAEEDPFGTLSPLAFEGDTTGGISVDPVFQSTPETEKIKRVLNMEAAVLKADPKVTRTRNAAYEEVHNKQWLWTMGSQRMLLSEQNWASIEATAMAENGKSTQSGFDRTTETSYLDLDWTSVARNAARMAVKLLGGKPVVSGPYPVILHNRAMVNVVSMVGHAFSGDSLNRGQSFLRQNELNKQLFSPKMKLTDDPFLRKRVGSALWDAEGTPTQRLTFVEEGTLVAFAHNRRSALEAKTQSTGHAVRPAIESAPIVGYHNLCLEPGATDLVDLMRDMHRGLLIYELAGLHTANLVTGDFSFGATGMWIENGQEQRPVDGITVAGNFKELLAKMIACDRNLYWFGTHGSPSVLFEEMQISGE